MKFSFIGWCKDESVNTDKVWCAIEISEGSPYWADNPKDWVYVTVWGRRGTKLRHKIVHSEYKLEWINTRSTFRSEGIGVTVNKKMKEYTPIDQTKLSEIYPEFEDDLKLIACWATLGID